MIILDSEKLLHSLEGELPETSGFLLMQRRRDHVWWTLAPAPRHSELHSEGDIQTFIASTLFFFFLRKISPELTSAANPPLFAEEAWP